MWVSPHLKFTILFGQVVLLKGCQLNFIDMMNTVGSNGVQQQLT